MTLDLNQRILTRKLVEKPTNSILQIEPFCYLLNSSSGCNLDPAHDCLLDPVKQSQDPGKRIRPKIYYLL